MKSLLVVLTVCLALVAARRFSRKSGDIVRTVNVLRAPPLYPNTFEVRAVRRNVKNKEVDAVQFLFSTNWVPRYVLHYFQRHTDSSELFKARWMLWKLIEYTENNGEDGFQVESDNIVQNYTLWDKQWSGLRYDKITFDGGEYYSFCSSLVSSSPSVSLCAYIADRETRQSNATLHPNALKWSLTVSNFPWALTTSRLALKVSFDSRDLLRDLDDDGNDQGVEVSVGDDVQAVASWVTDIQVTGPGCNPTGTVVRSVVYEGEQQRDVDVYFPRANDTDNLQISRTIRVSYFSFITNCQPESFTWDPEFGVSSAYTFLPMIALFLVLYSKEKSLES